MERHVHVALSSARRDLPNACTLTHTDASPGPKFLFPSLLLFCLTATIFSLPLPVKYECQIITCAILFEKAENA